MELKFEAESHRAHTFTGKKPQRTGRDHRVLHWAAPKLAACVEYCPVARLHVLGSRCRTPPPFGRIPVDPSPAALAAKVASSRGPDGCFLGWLPVGMRSAMVQYDRG